MKTRAEILHDLTVDELDWFVGYVEDCGSDYEGRKLAIKEMADFVITGGFSNKEDNALAQSWARRFEE
jgi:hypothetical protein